MDPFSTDSELVNIHTAFTQAQYNLVLSDYEATSFSESNRPAVQVLQYRAQLALGQNSKVLSTISATKASSSPDLAVVRLLALYLNGSEDDAASQAESLAEQHGKNVNVQILAGTVLARAGKQEQALQLLAKHEGSLDAVALIVQIHLSQNRVDLARKEAQSARAFAQDALGVNLCEAWVGMRTGGDAYQAAFYVFEELAQGPSTVSAASLIAQAVAELHLHRFEEAESALDQALALEPENETALTDKYVLDTITGKEATVPKGTELLEDLDAKREAFQQAMSKYSPKFEA
ncbi:hypothetical protein B0A48_08404 [Cryoendolithus antarcticus]|uniref:Coatomer subunit epsilon n=1 Tax=Cryoendolithus antarcticus TaxID=1507870 RepID=A0A1V8T5V3_9PEZI|nr:hypothetical protein B0A48_08404 [Cryoendolithus antarcticus]